MVWLLASLSSILKEYCFGPYVAKHCLGEESHVCIMSIASSYGKSNSWQSLYHLEGN